MADHETIITGGGDGGAGMVIGIIFAVALVIGALWLFNNGFFNGAGTPAVQVDAPAVTIPAPAPANG